MPIRQAGMLASRVSTWPRDHFCRSTIAPRPLRPTTWNEFLPISIPITAITLLSFSIMACSFCWVPLTSLLADRGQEHGRTIPLADLEEAPAVLDRPPSVIHHAPWLTKERNYGRWPMAAEVRSRTVRVGIPREQDRHRDSAEADVGGPEGPRRSLGGRPPQAAGCDWLSARIGEVAPCECSRHSRAWHWRLPAIRGSRA